MLGNAGNALVPLTMFAWVPGVLYIFKRLEPRKAAACAFVAGWMFLPVAAFKLPGLPDYTKMTATCTGILLGAYVFDRDTLTGFKFAPVDIPMLLWCTCPFLSSVFNGLGPYDGVSSAMYQSITWGLPYFIARIYFNDPESQRTLCWYIFLGGVIYIPFCLIEMRMSPQLHRNLYGYHQHSFLQTIRGDGFRPMVFMEHGLMVAMWMISASFIGIWFKRVGLMPDKVFGIPSKLLLGMLLVTTLLMKSTGAVGLLFAGLVCLLFSVKTRTTLLIWALLAVPPAYVVARSSGMWSGEKLTTWISEKYSEERGQSLQFRFDNENILVVKAMEGTFFGWGGWGRSRVYDEDGKDISVTDGLWIIVLGTRGLYGVILLILTIQLPVLLLLHRRSPAGWTEPDHAPAAVMAVLLALYMIDNLLNAMVNPMFMLFAGGMCGMLGEEGQQMHVLQEGGAVSVVTPRPVVQRTRFLTDGGGVTGL